MAHARPARSATQARAQTRPWSIASRSSAAMRAVCFSLPGGAAIGVRLHHGQVRVETVPPVPRVRYALHNLLAHPLLVLHPRLGSWLHDHPWTAPEPSFAE